MGWRLLLANPSLVPQHRVTPCPLHFHQILTSGTTSVRFVCLNTGLLSFTLTMVTIISKESLCRKGEATESKIKVRPLGGDPDLQRGWWMWLWFAASPQCGWVGFVPTRSPFPEPRALCRWGERECPQRKGHPFTSQSGHQESRGKYALPFGPRDRAECLQERSPAQQRSDKSGTPAARCPPVCENKKPAIVEASHNVLTLSKIYETNTCIAESETLLGFILFWGISKLSFLHSHPSALESCFWWSQSTLIFQLLSLWFL